MKRKLRGNFSPIHCGKCHFHLVGSLHLIEVDGNTLVNKNVIPQPLATHDAKHRGLWICECEHKLTHD